MPNSGCLSVFRDPENGAEPSVNSGRVKETYIDFTNSFYFLKYLVEINQSPEGHEVLIYGLSVSVEGQSCFGNASVDAKAITNFADF